MQDLVDIQSKKNVKKKETVVTNHTIEENEGRMFSV